MARFVRRHRCSWNRSLKPWSKGSALRGNSHAAAEAIRANLQSLGMSNGFHISQDELPRAFWRMERQKVAAAVVFLDPPYRMKAAYAKTLRALADSPLIWARSMAVAEHAASFGRRADFGKLGGCRLMS